MRKKIIIGIIVSLLLIFLSFMKVDFSKLEYTLKNANYFMLIPIFFLVVISMYFRALRWRILIAPIKKIRIQPLFSASSIGLMFNNLLPARIGEIVRAWLIGNEENISKSSVIATIVVERVFDGITALIVLTVVQLLYPFTIPPNLRIALYILVSASILIVVYFFYSRDSDYSEIKGLNLLLRLIPKIARDKVYSLIVSFREGLKILSNATDILKTIIISFAVWIPIIVIIYLSIESVGINISIFASIVTFVILSFGLMIPSAPGFIGTIQYSFIIALNIFRISNDGAIAASVMYHIGTFISINILGIFFVLKSDVKIGNIRKFLNKS